MLAAPWHAANADDAEAAMLVGMALAGSGMAAPAAELLGLVAGLRPEAAHPVREVIAMLDTRKDYLGLGPLLEESLARFPDDHRLLTEAGAWLQQTGATDRALAVLERARSLHPDYAPAEIAWAAALADSGEAQQGIATLRRLIAEGRGDVACWSNLGTMLALGNRFEEADAAFTKARLLDPRHWTVVFNHGMTLLKWGRLRDGWPAFNMRLLLPGQSILPLRTLLPRLAPGGRLDGRTVLITHDSGFGDTLQFIRYAEKLADLGATVLLWVPPPLVRLMGTVRGITRVFSERGNWPDFDFHCPIMRLPDVFGTGLGEIPARIPYIEADPALVACWQARLAPARKRRRVGICWAGSAREGDPRLQAVDRRRSMDAELLRPILQRAPHVQWIGLQLGRPHELPIEDPMPEVGDFADTAAIIALLDLVVTVDTAVLHLAGSMGKTVILLDRYDNCWRWMHGRADTPWYPGLRIFRQASWGDWSVPLRLLAAVI